MKYPLRNTEAETELVFLAKEIPPLGFKTYYMELRAERYKKSTGLVKIINKNNKKTIYMPILVKQLNENIKMKRKYHYKRGDNVTDDLFNDENNLDSQIIFDEASYSDDNNNTNNKLVSSQSETNNSNNNDTEITIEQNTEIDMIIEDEEITTINSIDYETETEIETEIPIEVESSVNNITATNITKIISREGIGETDVVKNRLDYTKAAILKNSEDFIENKVLL